MAAATRSMRVMVVDASADTVDSTAMLFRLDGHEVVTAASGASAYLRLLMIQLVAISSNAPKNTLVAVVALTLARIRPDCWPATIVSRISFR